MKNDMVCAPTLTLTSATSVASENNRLCLISGSANVSLSQEVAQYLGIDLTFRHPTGSYLRFSCSSGLHPK